MRSVRLFDYIEFDGGSWQIVALEGTLIALKNLSTNRIRKLPLLELLGDESYLRDSPDRLPNLDDVAVLETLDAEARTRTEFLHRHVVEVLTGVPPSDGVTMVTPLPEYDPANRLADRIEAKLDELQSAGTPIGERSFKRYLSAYRKDGIAGLVDGRRTKEASTTGRIDPRVVTLLEQAIAGQLNLSTGTRYRVINQVSVQVKKEGLPLPSRATMYRALSSRDQHAPVWECHYSAHAVQPTRQDLGPPSAVAAGRAGGDRLHSPRLAGRQP
jgi:putative transposase